MNDHLLLVYLLLVAVAYLIKFVIFLIRDSSMYENNEIVLVIVTTSPLWLTVAFFWPVAVIGYAYKKVFADI
jgi:hypothetical protein